jgi:hypothetical protein
VKAHIHLMFFFVFANFSHKKANFRDQGVMFGILVVLSADVDRLFSAKLEQSSAGCSSQFIFYCLAQRVSSFTFSS